VRTDIQDPVLTPLSEWCSMLLDIYHVVVSCFCLLAFHLNRVPR